MTKPAIKRAFLSLLSVMGRLPSSHAFRERVAKTIVPKVLGPDVIPRKLVPRPLRGSSLTLLCDPYVYVHRAPYFFGALFETDLQRYIERYVRHGDTVIDVGCNAGHVAIIGARAVGSTGRVIAFEPNPQLVSVVQEHLDSLQLTNVTLLPFALGSEDSNAELEFSEVHTGGATLCQGRFSSGEVGKTTITVEVRRGDELFADQRMPGNVFMKIDVEGYELTVLEGFSQILSNRVDHAVIEVTPRWIGGREGVARIFNLMEKHGFEAHTLLLSGEPGNTLKPEGVSTQMNLLFLKK